MRNLVLSPYFAEARAAGRKTVTRRQTCTVREGQVVFHGENLVLDVGQVYYARDLAPLPGAAWPWRRRVLLARYCPAHHARLFSRIVSIRQGLLTDITEDEIRKEGIRRFGHGWQGPADFHETAEEAFKAWWKKLHGGHSWKGLVYRIDLGKPLNRTDAGL